jgi:hypothetical protein
MCLGAAVATTLSMLQRAPRRTLRDLIRPHAEARHPLALKLCGGLTRLTTSSETVGRQRSDR